jgi:hypothetical protein
MKVDDCAFFFFVCGRRSVPFRVVRVMFVVVWDR